MGRLSLANLDAKYIPEVTPASLFSSIVFSKRASTESIFGMVLLVLSVPLFLYGNFWRLIVAMTLRGALRVLIGSAGSAWTAELVPVENRGKVNGSAGFFSLIAISLGQLLGGWLYDNLGHSTPVILQAVFMIPSFLIILLKTKEPPGSLD